MIFLLQIAYNCLIPGVSASSKLKKEVYWLLGRPTEAAKKKNNNESAF